MLHVSWISMFMLLELNEPCLLVASFPVPARPYATCIGGVPHGWDLRSRSHALKGGYGQVVSAIKLTTSDLGEKFPFGLVVTVWGLGRPFN